MVWVAGAGFFAAREPVIGTALFSRGVWRQVYSSLIAWDGQWYVAAATRGYGSAGVNPDGQSTAPFFPLLPGLIKTLGVIKIPPGVAGLIVSAGAFLCCLLLLHGIAWRKGGESMARRATWFAAFSPFSFVFSMIYPDGVFMAASLGAFLLVRRERWVLAFVVAVPAALVRPNGFVLAIAIAYAAWRAGGEIRVRVARVIPVALPFSAVGGWVLALQSFSGDGFSFITSKSAWDELAIWDAVPATVNLLTGATGGRPLPVAAVIHLGLAALGGVILVAGRQIYDRGWGVLCVLVLVGPAILGIIGLARYMAALFPLYLALAHLLKEGSKVERWLIYGAGLFTPVVLAGVFMGRLVP